MFLDFEFNQTVEPNVNLVSCCTYDGKNKNKFWLHNSPNEKARLAEHLLQYDLIIGYACVAEARSFIALGLDPLEFKWIDLFLEYRMLTNHNDELQWGRQLKDGKIIYAKKPKPKWERTEEESEAGFKPTHSLAEATFKLTGEIRDTKHKTKTRELIISNPKEFTQDERRQILDYNMEDVVFLPNIWEKTKEKFRELAPEVKLKDYLNEAINRGRYSAHTAIMESAGYPINFEATRNFSKQIPNIIMECQRDINAQFPDIKPFKWNRKNNNFTWDQNTTREWIKKNHDVKKWVDTDKGNISLALEAWERFYQFKHDYPEGNFGAQMVRFLKLKQSLYGFGEGGKRKSFWDSVGSDGRVRPYMNIYGAQSGRSQPAASGFMFLKPAWMRSLVQPAKGKFIAGIDYGQQEFFLAGLESEDKTMIEAYLSGDPYLYGAKLAGVIPQAGTKESHKIERDLFKNTYLGINYGMTKYGLAIKLTNDTGREYTEEDAQDQIDLFEETYEDYIEWKKELEQDYLSGEVAIRLPCGWRMWNDNQNIRSVLNVPIQGFGASIMRKAVDIAVGYGCKVIFTLHDAIYIEDEVGNEIMIGYLYDAMREAFQYYFKGTPYCGVAGKIKLDPFAWSPDYKKDSELTVYNTAGEACLNVPCSNLYIDERAINEYERFKIYFNKSDTDLV